jgi:hypothetical protein
MRVRAVHLREQFEDQLPDLMDKESQQLRDRFEQDELPELLEKAEEQLRDKFEEELPELMTDA